MYVKQFFVSIYVCRCLNRLNFFRTFAVFMFRFEFCFFVVLVVVGMKTAKGMCVETKTSQKSRIYML